MITSFGVDGREAKVLHPSMWERFARQCTAKPNQAHANRKWHFFWSKIPWRCAQSSHGFAPSYPSAPWSAWTRFNLDPVAVPPVAPKWSVVSAATKMAQTRSALGICGLHAGQGAGKSQGCAEKMSVNLAIKFADAFTVADMHKWNWWSFLCLQKEAWNKLFYVQSLQ